jgi:hypothetical protein
MEHVRSGYIESSGFRWFYHDGILHTNKQGYTSYGWNYPEFEVRSVFPVSSDPSVLNIIRVGEYAYLMDSEDGLRVLDLNTPGIPSEVALHPDITHTSFRALPTGYMLQVVGNELRFFDVRDPLTPTLRGQFVLGEEWIPSAHYHLGGARMLLYYRNEAYETRHVIIDYSNPSAVEVIGEDDYPPTWATMGNRLLNIAGGALRTYNLTDPDNWYLESELQLFDPDDPDIWYTDIHGVIAGHQKAIIHLCTVIEDPFGFPWEYPYRYTVDYEDPANPVFIDQADEPRTPQWIRMGYYIHMVEGYGLTVRFMGGNGPFGWLNGYYPASPRYLILDPVFERILYVNNDGLGVLDASNALLGNRPVGEETGQSGNLPTSFTLHRPWPNPFNSTVQVGYSLPAPGEVVVSVYDILGRRVAVLQNGPQTAGSHQLFWDGWNQRGFPVASGQYFIEAKTQKQSQTRTVTLVK